LHQSTTKRPPELEVPKRCVLYENPTDSGNFSVGTGTEVNRHSTCSRDPTIPNIFCVKACRKCQSLGYHCQGLVGVRSSPWETQDQFYCPSQEQGSLGSPGPPEPRPSGTSLGTG